MQKVLIWDITFRLANVGGPAGYLYNLHEYLKQYPNPSIVFLSDLYSQTRTEDHTIRKTSSLKERLLRVPFIEYINDIIGCAYKMYHTSNVILPPELKISDYDFIHFHHPADVTRHRKILQNFKGKLICTCHCPCLMTDEIISNKGGFYKMLRPIMLRQELNAYVKADFLMFPCKEAREPYEKEKRIKRYFCSNEKKFFYCPSAIIDFYPNKEDMQPLSSFGIPDDAFVIAFFGRHNHIKGYDILKSVGKALLDKFEDLYILCAGKGPIEPLCHSRWIELGFINNTNELLPQCDLYVLPNKETYFDLVVLEVLRAGIPIIMSNTGGNKFFQNYSETLIQGIKFFESDNILGLVKLVSEMIIKKRLTPNDYKLIKDSNRELFMREFTLGKYVETYVSTIQNL